MRRDYLHAEERTDQHEHAQGSLGCEVHRGSAADGSTEHVDIFFVKEAYCSRSPFVW